MRTTWKPSSKKTNLTFLLSLTFLCLFSGSVYGDDLQDAKDAFNRQDYKTAHKLLLPLAEQGFTNAQRCLGRMYGLGEGVPQDEKEATKWIRLAAKQGDAGAQLSYGLSYYYGIGVPKDYVLAHMWYNLADSNGNKDAVKNRNTIEKRMSPQQIEKAQQLFKQKKEEPRLTAGKKAEIPAEELKKLMKGIKLERQKEFLNIVLSYRDKYNNSKNEIKKTLQRKKRIKSFKSLFESSLSFHSWVGKVSSMDTNADGDASLGIIIESKGGLVAELAEKERNLQGVIFAESKMNWLVPGGIVLVNNRQKIKMDDDLFDTIAEMEVGDKVIFSGEFELHPEDQIGRSKGWYIHTANPTEKGAMTSPVFVVGYCDIQTVNKYKKHKRCQKTHQTSKLNLCDLN